MQQIKKQNNTKFINIVAQGFHQNNMQKQILYFDTFMIKVQIKSGAEQAINHSIKHTHSQIEPTNYQTQREAAKKLNKENKSKNLFQQKLKHKIQKPTDKKIINKAKKKIRTLLKLKLDRSKQINSMDPYLREIYQNTLSSQQYWKRVDKIIENVSSIPKRILISDTVKVECE